MDNFEDSVIQFRKRIGKDVESKSQIKQTVPLFWGGQKTEATHSPIDLDVGHEKNTVDRLICLGI